MKVLTNHFSYFLSEKTTDDIPMKFSHCHFKTTFYRLPPFSFRIYLQIIHVRQKAVFTFNRTCIACFNNITFHSTADLPCPGSNYSGCFVCLHLIIDFFLTFRLCLLVESEVLIALRWDLGPNAVSMWTEFQYCR